MSFVVEQCSHKYRSRKYLALDFNGKFCIICYLATMKSQPVWVIDKKVFCITIRLYFQESFTFFQHEKMYWSTHTPKKLWRNQLKWLNMECPAHIFHICTFRTLMTCDTQKYLLVEIYFGLPHNFKSLLYGLFSFIIAIRISV